jgi:hypothetical protein
MPTRHQLMDALLADLAEFWFTCLVGIRSCPSGGPRVTLLRDGRSHAKGWEDGQAHKEMRSLWLQAPRKCSGWIES